MNKKREQAKINGNDLVTIVVACYNVEKYVNVCIKSILEQTYMNLEIILVNDGSLDNTGHLLDSYEDKRIIVVNQKNSGLSAARNTGLAIAKGKYICFIDGDDYIEPDYVEKMYNEAKKNKSEVVICGYKNVDEHGMVVKGSNACEAKVVSGKEALLDFLCKNRILVTVAWNKLYETDLFRANKIEYPNARLYEDSYTTYKLLFNAKKVSYIDKKLYNYVQRGGSIMSVAFSEERFRNIIYIIDETKAYLTARVKEGSLDKELLAYESNWLAYALRYAIKNRLYCSARNEAVKRLLRNKNEIRKSKSTSRTAKIFTYFGAFLRGGIVGRFFRKIKLVCAKLSLIAKIAIESVIFRKKIYIANTPLHGNLGDQAILSAEIELLKATRDEFRIIEIPNFVCNRLPWYVKRVVGKSPVCIQGGGHFGDLWPVEDIAAKKIISLFPQKNILVFPQTLCVKNVDSYLKQSKNTLGKNNVIIFTRDRYSYENIKKYKDKNIFYSPDIVLYKERREYDKEKKIMLCLRRDLEKTIDLDTESELYFAIKKYNYELTDTVIDKDIFKINREEEIDKLLNRIGSSELLITDRLHGMIFAYLTKTPCLVFNSKSPKVLGVYDWLSEADYITLHDSKKSIAIEIHELLNRDYSFNGPISRQAFNEIERKIAEII